MFHYPFERTIRKKENIINKNVMYNSSASSRRILVVEFVKNILTQKTKKLN